MVVHRNLHIEGHVQRVGFRYYAQKSAIALGLYGFVKNLPDGSVYLEVEGEESLIAELYDWCRTGPSMAEVSNIRITDGIVQGFDSFEILH